VSLEGARKVSDVAVLALLKNCGSLRFLSVKASGVTCGVLEKMGEDRGLGRGLEVLALDDVEGDWEDMVREVRRARKRLVVVVS